MSVLTAESPKDCSQKGLQSLPRRLGAKKLLVAVFSAVFSLLSFALILWLTLRPSPPRFSLPEATAYDLGLPNATVDATFAARNPNARAAALCDGLWARAAYAGGEPLAAAAAALPPFDLPEGGGGASFLPASLASGGAPVSPAVSFRVGRDVEAAGRVVLRFRVGGQLRWKVGAWVTGRHGLDVECIAAFAMLPPSSPAYGGRRVGVLQGAQCATNV